MIKNASYFQISQKISAGKKLRRECKDLFLSSTEQHFFAFQIVWRVLYSTASWSERLRRFGADHRDLFLNLTHKVNREIFFSISSAVYFFNLNF